MQQFLFRFLHKHKVPKQPQNNGISYIHTRGGEEGHGGTCKSANNFFFYKNAFFYKIYKNLYQNLSKQSSVANLSIVDFQLRRNMVCMHRRSLSSKDKSELHIENTKQQKTLSPECVL